MNKILDRLLGAPEEINGDGRCPTYLWRWTIFKFRGRGVYLHHFVGDDWSRDLHDHPKRFISIGLRGGYMEWAPGYDPADSLCDIQRLYRAPWIRTFPADHIHRISMFSGPDGSILDCWTLVIVLKPVRSWGFWANGKFVGWREYVGSERADKMKTCD